MSALLIVEHLTKIFEKMAWFGGSRQRFTAIDDLSFHLGQAEILGILGSNGAGKTTTIQILLSSLTPTSGNISYFGKSLFKHRSRILQHVAFASTYVKMPAVLTVGQNLDIYAHLYGLSYYERKRAIRHFLEVFDVAHTYDKPMGTLSAGQSTRVMLAKAFLTSPKIILLDEPTASLDPESTLIVRHCILQERKEKGVAFLVTSHDMDEVAAMCDRVLVMKHGKLIASDMPANLAATVHHAKIHLIFKTPLQEALSYIENRGIRFIVEGALVTVEVGEQRVAQFLQDLPRHGIE
jgi:ABC-2 type transport system ATP-binding protein